MVNTKEELIERIDEYIDLFVTDYSFDNQYTSRANRVITDILRYIKKYLINCGVDVAYKSLNKTIKRYSEEGKNIAQIIVNEAVIDTLTELKNDFENVMVNENDL